MVEVSAAAWTAGVVETDLAAGAVAAAVGAVLDAAAGAAVAGEEVAAGVGGVVSCWPRQYCTPKMTPIMTMSMMRKERLS